MAPVQQSLEIPIERNAARPETAPATRTLAIVHMLSSLNVGGMEQFVLRIAKAQSVTGHRVSIVALRDGPLAEEARRLGLRTFVLRAPSKIMRVAGCLACIARVRPDIINVHNPTSLHYAALARKVGKSRIVLTFHGEGKGGVAREPTEQEWSKVDALVAVSSAAANQMRVPGASRPIQVILNGIELSEPRVPRSTVRANLGIGDEPVGIMVARIDGYKGHDTLLKALVSLRKRGGAMRMLIAGDGAQRAAMEELAASLNLGRDSVTFLGYRSDVRDLLGASDLFVLPSLTEGLPLSVLEAMAARLPVVATPVGGIPELVEDGRHGYLVPVGDAEALASALERLASDADLRKRTGEAGFARAASDYSFEEMTKQYLRLYRQLLEQPARHAD